MEHSLETVTGAVTEVGGAVLESARMTVTIHKTTLAYLDVILENQAAIMAKLFDRSLDDIAAEMTAHLRKSLQRRMEDGSEPPPVPPGNNGVAGPDIGT
jgi:hypothetical protein